MRCPSGKVRHRSKEIACIVATRTKRKPIMNVYGCDTCGGWHLGRTNDPGRQADWIGVLLKRHAERASLTHPNP